jgi:hypothetical protein
MGSSKKAIPSVITLCHKSAEMPTFLRYKNPTSINAYRNSSRKAGLVWGLRARERSRIGIELNEDIMVCAVFVVQLRKERGTELKWNGVLSCKAL